MSKNLKCPICASKANRSSVDYPTGVRSAKLGHEIVVPGVSFFKCSDAECAFEWMPGREDDRIRSYISKYSVEVATPPMIARLREIIGKAIGAHTKTSVAEFLLLNAKAFSRWETGKDEISPAYDLLLRLAAHSKENVEFIQNLHSKGFAFEENDYEVSYSSVIEGRFSLVTTFATLSGGSLSEMSNQIQEPEKRAVDEGIFGMILPSYSGTRGAAYA